MGGKGDMENCFQKVNSAKSICTKNNIVEVIQVYFFIFTITTLSLFI